jgi:cysteine desulfurase family protein
MEKYIYFDNAATTFPKPECVYEAINDAGRNYAVNAGRGSYALAQKASMIISETKTLLKNLAGADAVAEVVLTASATVACNQILGGLDWQKTDVVYVSPFEHNAIMRVLHLYQKQYGFEIEELAMKENEIALDLEKIRYQFLRKKPSVVAMSHVSNVVGYVLPIEEVAEYAREYQAIVVVDGAQAMGLVPVQLKKTGIDFYVFAGHKTLYGPLGTGGFVTSGRIKLRPVLAGGTGSDSKNLEMPEMDAGGMEPGSPNVVAIAGLRAALQELVDTNDMASKPAISVSEIQKQEQKLTAYLLQKLESIKRVQCYAVRDLAKQVGIVSFNIQGYQASDVGMILDQDYGIAVRTGYQCAPLIHKYLADELYAGVVRAGLGRFTTVDEIDTLYNAVREIAEG